MLASSDEIEEARHNLQRAIERELPGPDPARGQRLERAITEMILAVVKELMKPSK